MIGKLMGWYLGRKLPTSCLTSAIFRLTCVDTTKYERHRVHVVWCQSTAGLLKAQSVRYYLS